MNLSEAKRDGCTPLTGEQIMAADDLAVEWVPTAEWAPEGADAEGVGVFVRTMTASERDAFEVSCLDKQGKARNLTNLRARLCALTIVDGDGKRIFDATQAADLGTKSGQVLDRIFDKAQRLNGITKADVDELAGN